VDAGAGTDGVRRWRLLPARCGRGEWNIRHGVLSQISLAMNVSPSVYFQNRKGLLKQEEKSIVLK